MKVSCSQCDGLVNEHGYKQTNFQLVHEFHEKFCPEQNEANMGNLERQELRISLIEEEFGELLDGLGYSANWDPPQKEYPSDSVKVADALTDLLYVIYGAGHAFGIDLDACFREVHRSNMTKLGEDGNAIIREDGKVMKGPNYDPPHLEQFIS